MVCYMVVHNMCVCVHVCVCEWYVQNYSVRVGTSKAKVKNSDISQTLS